jgi:hypothetical protein
VPLIDAVLLAAFEDRVFGNDGAKMLIPRQAAPSFRNDAAPLFRSLVAP